MSETISNSTPTAKVQFISSHLPPLEDGDYTLTVDRQVEIDGLPALRYDATSQHTLCFSVYGPRFSLDPQEVHAVFPPDKSLGSYDNVLPQIVLERTTLPWERTMDGKPPKVPPVPWLALLLFDRSEIDFETMTTTITVGEAANDLGLTPESAQSLDDRVRVIDVPGALLQQVFPWGDVSWLSHVRQGQTAEGGPSGREYAVVVCPRLPRPGSDSVVHLVSLEGQSALVGERSLLRRLRNRFASPPSSVRLVSLASWRFSSLPVTATFTELLTEAHREPYELRLPDPPPGLARDYLRQGYVAVPHLGRQGNRTVSWYRSPLLPVGSPAAAPDVEFPRAADELVRYHSKVGMFDVTYAAAWELGRLLTLQSRRVALALFHWKRERTQQTSQDLNAVRHLPVTARLRRPPVPLPDVVRQWFEQMALLEPVPFHYLVPREEMLPAESIRFFQVDPVWILCLLDGAFSLGRVLATDPQKVDAALASEVLPQHLPVVSGFLLRSRAVAAWPDLGVEGTTASGPAQLVRQARLATDVLLCLFQAEEVVQAVKLHQHPEPIHCGATWNDEQTKCTKTLRNLDTGIPGPSVAVPWRNDQLEQRTIDVAQLIENAKKGGVSIASSADFAAAMIEGVDEVQLSSQP
jgi:hypothetical protein